MPAEQIITIVIAVISSTALTAAVNGLFNRRKTSVEADSFLVKTAQDTVKNLVDPLNARVDQLENERDELRSELEGQAITLENLQEMVMKLQLAMSINQAWAKANRISLPITIESLSELTVDGMRDIAYSVRNIQDRRRQRQGGDE